VVDLPHLHVERGLRDRAAQEELSAGRVAVAVEPDPLEVEIPTKEEDRP
jgi:hypothetical protein